MLKLTEIMTAIEQLIKGEFPDTIIYEDAVPKDFVRPSFLVSCLETKMKSANKTTVLLRQRLQITCFDAVDEFYHTKTRRLIDQQQQAALLFSEGYIAVCDRFITASAKMASLEVGAAAVELSLEYYDDKPTAEQSFELMGDAELELIKEK